MKLSLDTNAYSAFKNGNLELMRMLEDADELFVSATVLGELYSDFQIGRLTEKNSTELNTFLSKPRAASLLSRMRLHSGIGIS